MKTSARAKSFALGGLLALMTLAGAGAALLPACARPWPATPCISDLDCPEGYGCTARKGDNSGTNLYCIKPRPDAGTADRGHPDTSTLDHLPDTARSDTRDDVGATDRIRDRAPELLSSDVVQDRVVDAGEAGPFDLQVGDPGPEAGGLCDPDPCHGHGSCDPGDGTCTCAPGWAGPACDCDAHGAGPCWLTIPGGTFVMGCSPGDSGCDSDEIPRHSVTISAFEMTATEITQQQYEAVVGSNPSNHTGCPTCPVEQVSWHDATAFCTTIGGWLPTEAEWEYAARAGTTTKYYCGDDVVCLDGIAWYADNSDAGSGRQTHPVGEKRANGFGLFDMLGNVWEWTADWYDEAYYSHSPEQDPQGPESGRVRVLRGGSYVVVDTDSLRTSHRHNTGPDTRNHGLGFRCARDLPAADAGVADVAAADAPIPDRAQGDAVPADTVAQDGFRPDAVAADPFWLTIPGGTFEMGCSPGDTGCYGDESPVHTVTITAFELTATEITQQQYQGVIDSNPSSHTGCPTCPVEQVSWHDATAFCAATGGRLPTEAEWEYAARAGTTTKYFCGDNADCLDGIAWYSDNSDAGSGRQTHPVGEKTANGFGLFDMLGNVWEWNADRYDAAYYASSPTQDPTGPVTGTYRVIRGGSFNNDDYFLRASSRHSYSPDLTDALIGLRCARDAP